MIGKIRTSRKTRFQERTNVAAHLFGLRRLDHAGNVQRAHQANGAKRNLRGLGQRVIAKDTEFQAAATQIDDATRLSFRPQSGKDGFAAEARFLPRADHFELQAGGLLYAANQNFAILRFTGGAGGHGAILRDGIFIHDFPKLAKDFDALLEDFFAETVTDKHAFPKAQRAALRHQRFDIESGIGARNGQAHCIGAGVDGGDVDGLRHVVELTARDERERRTACIWWRECQDARQPAGGAA